MSGTKGMIHYRLETKLLAIQLHEQDGLTYAEVAKQLEIRKPSRIEAWYLAYQREGELAFHKHIGRPLKRQQTQETLEQLRRENALLKKFHSELRQAMLARRNIGSSSTTEEPTR